MSYSIVGEQILKFRKERGLTQRELGDAIGVSSSAVSQWESGGTPDISLLPALSDILGVTVDSLFGRCETRREDIEETVGKYIVSFPEEKRMERIVSLMRQATVYGCTDRVAAFVDFSGSDSELICISKDGFATSILSEGQSFLSAAWCREGEFSDLLDCGESVVRLFSMMSKPKALTLLSKLYGEAPRHRTAGVLAKLCGMAQSEAEEILRQFAELDLINVMELETETGSTYACAVNQNGAIISLLAAAHLVADRSSGFRLINDKRAGKKEENE